MLEAVSTLAIAIASAAVVWSVFFASARTKPISAKSTSRWQTVAGLETTVGPNSVNHGRARIALIEFSDFQCPYCARYAANVFPLLKKEFVDTQEIEYVFRSVPLETIHPEALTDAQAAVCAAAQDQTFDFRELLFRSDRKVPQDKRFEQFVSGLGIDVSVFSRCMPGESAEIVKRDLQEGQRLGVRSTPTFLLGEVNGDRITLRGRMEGAPSIEAFRKAIADALTRVSRP